MKITKKEFNLFVEECEKWQKYFQLNDWRIDYYFEKLNGATASCYRILEDKVAEITLNTIIGRDDNSTCLSHLKETALHEVLHILLSDITLLAQKRFISKDEIDIAEHSLIRKLETIIK